MNSNILDRFDTILNNNKYRILSGSVLKMLALITMLIDHTASVLLWEMDFANDPIISIGSHEITIYWICRTVGRIAFPIYCFLITEGYLHTHNKKQYGINLLVFALISEIPWNLEHSGSIFYERQNVFFTLFLGYLAIVCYEKYKNKKALLLFTLMIIFGVSLLLKADYGTAGIGFILFLYFAREHKIVQAIIGSCFFSKAWAILLAFIPINMYNGKRGFIKSKVSKYIFYAAYPLHLTVLYILKINLIGY